MPGALIGKKITRSALRGRPQFVVESVCVVVVGWSFRWYCASGHGCGNGITQCGVIVCEMRCAGHPILSSSSLNFQTAAVSVGFDLNAIEHERSSSMKRFNTKSQRMQNDHVEPVSYYNDNDCDRGQSQILISQVRKTW